MSILNATIIADCQKCGREYQGRVEHVGQIAHECGRTLCDDCAVTVLFGGPIIIHEAPPDMSEALYRVLIGIILGLVAILVGVLSAILLK